LVNNNHFKSSIFNQIILTISIISLIIILKILRILVIIITLKTLIMTKLLSKNKNKINKY